MIQKIRNDRIWRSKPSSGTINFLRYIWTGEFYSVTVGFNSLISQHNFLVKFEPKLDQK